MLPYTVGPDAVGDAWRAGQPRFALDKVCHGLASYRRPNTEQRPDPAMATDRPQAAPPSIDEYLTVRKAARFLGVSASTLRNWDKQGKLTASRHPLNGYRLYTRADLEAILNTINRREDS